VCLQFAGRQSFSNVVTSRSRKTEFFVQHKVKFLDKLWEELCVLDSKEECAIRLNLLSDVDWEVEFAKLGHKISDLKNIQFYDYTKDHPKALRKSAKNYHITLSFSGHNWKQCESYLEKGGNVAVVFKNSVPSQWNGFEVIDGDLSDERYYDKKGTIVGLKYKTPKGVKYSKSKFVVDEEKNEEGKGS
jgi:hypothetical protein